MTEPMNANCWRWLCGFEISGQALSHHRIVGPDENKHDDDESLQEPEARKTWYARTLVGRDVAARWDRVQVDK